MITLLNTYLARLLYVAFAQNIWTQSFAIVLSDGIVLFAIVAYVFVILPLRKNGTYTRTIFHDLLPGAVTLLIAYVLKVTVGELRPYAVLHFQPYVFATDPHASFPSSHVAFTTAFAVTLFGSHRKLGILVATIIPLVMIGRMAVGVHWFTDVLAGLVLGLIVGILFRKFSSAKTGA